MSLFVQLPNVRSFVLHHAIQKNLAVEDVNIVFHSVLHVKTNSVRISLLLVTCPVALLPSRMPFLASTQIGSSMQSWQLALIWGLCLQRHGNLFRCVIMMVD